MASEASDWWASAAGSSSRHLVINEDVGAEGNIGLPHQPRAELVSLTADVISFSKISTFQVLKLT